MSDIVKDFVKALKSEKTTSAYDTTAVVTRVEDDVAWVHIAGGVDETPVRLTINAKAGDSVQVRVSGGRAWLTGNLSAPPTDNEMAQKALDYGKIANDAAQKAVADAQVANEAASSAKRSADEAQRTAESVEGIARHAEEVAEGVEAIAERAETSAGEAKASAENASEYAARALGNLSTVQNVTETLNWITAHGTMTLTSDTALDPTHVYFVLNDPPTGQTEPHGDYHVGSHYYDVVTEPSVDDISTYYELSIDESLNNYVATHLAVDSEGLWIIPDAGGNKVLIATGGGSTYTTAGTYIIGKVNNVDTIFAEFSQDGTTIMAENGTQIAHLGYGEVQWGSSIYKTPYYTLGVRSETTALWDDSRQYTKGDMCVYNGKIYVCQVDESTIGEWETNQWRYYIGSYSFSEGYNTVTCELATHAEGENTQALGVSSHAEGYNTKAYGNYSHAEGERTFADNYHSHAEGYNTKAYGSATHAEGENTQAFAVASHAEGMSTVAHGYAAHAQNYHTVTNENYQTAIGKYNDNQSDNAFEIGNGAYNNRSNAFEVDWDGNTGQQGRATTKDLTSTEIDAIIQELGLHGRTICPYDVGDIYITRSSINPATKWQGTTWRQMPSETDYIVDEGTSGIWTYRKWASGVGECWTEYATGSMTFSSYGNIYTGIKAANIAFPFTFAERPVVTGSCTISSWIWFIYADYDASKISNLRFAKSSSSSESTSVGLYVKGRWKTLEYENILKWERLS